MLKKNTIKLICFLSFSLISIESKALYYNHNYFGTKATMLFPTSIEGNSDLKSTAPKNTYSIGIFLGRKFMENFAFEVELSQRKKSNMSNSSLANNINTTNNWGINSRTVMFNLSADLLENKILKPYVKGGIGLSQNKSDDYTQNSDNSTTTWQGKSNNSFAWNIGFGIDISSSKNIDSFIEYMFTSRGKFTTQNGANSSQNGQTYYVPPSTASAKVGYLKEHAISVGLKVKF